MSEYKHEEYVMDITGNKKCKDIPPCVGCDSDKFSSCTDNVMACPDFSKYANNKSKGCDIERTKAQLNLIF